MVNVTEHPGEDAVERLLAALRAREGDRYLDQREVCRITSLHRNTIYRLEQAAAFPRRRHLTGGKVAWLASEVQQWMQSRPTSEEARQAATPPRRGTR